MVVANRGNSNNRVALGPKAPADPRKTARLAKDVRNGPVAIGPVAVVAIVLAEAGVVVETAVRAPVVVALETGVKAGVPGAAAGSVPMVR